MDDTARTRNRGRYVTAGRLTTRQRAITAAEQELQLDGCNPRTSTDEAA